jgi:RNA polymerase sigma factor (sigma-70 family)
VLLGRAAPERAAPDQPAFEADNLYTTLRNLPRGQREVLVLRFLCDLSVEDTAAALRCSTGNVKSQTSRGLEAMRRLLASDGSRSLT